MDSVFKKKIVLLALILCVRFKARSTKKPRRFWIRPTLMQKRTEALLENAFEDDIFLNPSDLSSRGYFQSFTRMPQTIFEELYELVKLKLQKKTTNCRSPISPLERFTLTMRYLATGDNWSTLETLFGISKSSISKIIPETCREIIDALKNFISTPTQDDWKKVSARFEDRWQFPHCLGAIDGRHCPIIKPQFTGSDYFNYKHFFSLVLLAVVDADYQFLYVDVGAQGSMSDGGVFNRCAFANELKAGHLNLPGETPLPGRQFPVPYVFVVDDAFALTVNCMKGYSGLHDSTSPERMFNHRLSRARTRVENAFGILSSRFRVLRKPMHLNEETATSVILATCYLHNFIRKRIDESGDEVMVDFLTTVDPVNNEGFFPLRNQARRSGEAAKKVRDEFCRYFSSAEGFLPWPIEQ